MIKRGAYLQSSRDYWQLTEMNLKRITPVNRVIQEVECLVRVRPWVQTLVLPPKNIMKSQELQG
jgi:hypothetical protein